MFVSVRCEINAGKLCLSQQGIGSFVKLLLLWKDVMGVHTAGYSVITARKRSLGQGYILALVCHSVYRRGRPRQVPPGQVHPLAGTPPGRYTPLGRYTPWEGIPWQVHPRAGNTPGQVQPWAFTPPRQVPPWAGTPPTRVGTPPSNACWDTVNKRAVHILLECILVYPYCW